MEFLKTSYAERKKLIAKFVNWDDPNFAIDEQWARFYPYGQEVHVRDEVKTSVVISNHSNKEREYKVTLRGELLKEPITGSIQLAAGKDGTLSFGFKMPDVAESGKVYLITSDIEIDDERKLLFWGETLLKVVD
jgi:hypothetical protein